jgi:hypothetical protein
MRAMVVEINGVKGSTLTPNISESRSRSQVHACPVGVVVYYVRAKFGTRVSNGVRVTALQKFRETP